MSTDKVDTEIPSPSAGALPSIKVPEDETVDVGTELAVIGERRRPAAPGDRSRPRPRAAQHPSRAGAGRTRHPGPPPQPATPASPAQTRARTGPPHRLRPAAGPGRPAPARRRQPPPADPSARLGRRGRYVTPLVRKLAAEHGVDLDSITGTGVGGRIRKQDVIAPPRRKQAAAAGPAAAAAGRPQPPRPGRAAAGESARCAAAPRRCPGRARSSPSAWSSRCRSPPSSPRSSRSTSPRSPGCATRKKADFQAREGVKLSFLPFFAMAAVEALKQHPKLNAVIDNETNEVTYHDAEHLGIAVDTERGLMAAVIKNAGDLNLAGLARKIADLAERTRTNKMPPDELAGGTFTLTNTGSRGALFDTPIMNQPQVGMLGTGAVVKRPVVVDDPDLGETIAIRSMVYLALTYDHRLVDGADAARFLTAVKQRLEEAQFDV